MPFKEKSIKNEKKNVQRLCFLNTPLNKQSITLSHGKASYGRPKYAQRMSTLIRHKRVFTCSLATCINSGKGGNKKIIQIRKNEHLKTM